MPIISVAHGWQHILDEAVAEASKLPEEWLLEIVYARRVDGMLDLWATYAARDIPLDDYLPADKKIPHPYRSFIRIRDKARQKSLVTCECCGRMGKVIGAGDEARMRCRGSRRRVRCLRPTRRRWRTFCRTSATGWMRCKSWRGGMTMTRGIKIEVGDGWAAIVLSIIRIGSAYPEHWNFHYHRAWRACGRAARPRCAMFKRSCRCRGPVDPRHKGPTHQPIETKVPLIRSGDPRRSPPGGRKSLAIDRVWIRGLLVA
jgi:hypothetical protein